MDLHSPLKKFFGFNKFKGLQEEVIKSIVNQNNTFNTKHDSSLVRVLIPVKKSIKETTDM